MKNMRNMKIRTALEKAGMRQWELAELLGVSEGNFSRRMRRELPEEDQERIISLIICESERRKDQQLREELERRKNA